MPTKYFFEVFRSDNQLIATLNGNPLCNDAHEGDPKRDIRIDITDRLIPGIDHKLIVELWNYGSSSGGWDNPWHAEYRVIRVDSNGNVTKIIEVDEQGPGTRNRERVRSYEHLIRYIAKNDKALLYTESKSLGDTEVDPDFIKQLPTITDDVVFSNDLKFEQHKKISNLKVESERK